MAPPLKSTERNVWNKHNKFPPKWDKEERKYEKY